ncbi:MAG: S24 family peptidase [Bacteroidota bacterium]
MSEETITSEQAGQAPRRETDRRVLLAIAEVMTVHNFRNERQFLVSNGFNEALLYKIRKGIQSAGEELIAILSTKYGVDANFIFTGIGSPLRSQVPGSDSEAHNLSSVPFDKLPFIPVRAAATFIETFDDLKNEPLSFFPVTRELARAYPKGLIIEISGDSMADQLKHGSKVIAIPVLRGDWQYQSSGVYAVMYREYFVVKRIKDNQLMRQNLLELHSDNPRSGSMPVPGDELRAIWKVVKLVESNVE